MASSPPIRRDTSVGHRRRLALCACATVVLVAGPLLAAEEPAPVTIALDLDALINSAVAQMNAIQAPERLTSINLAPQQVVTLLPEQYEVNPTLGVQTLTGALDDGGRFLISNGHGVSHGAIWTAHGAWEIRGDGEQDALGRTLLEASPVKAAAECLGGLEPQPGSSLLEPDSESGSVSITADPEDTVRVLILYDARAVADEGDMNTFAAAAISSANQAYLNSEISPLQLELAGIEEVAEPETRTASFVVRQLTDRYDNAYDQVQALRDAYDADLVAFLSYLDDACGIAWLAPDDQQLGFSVISTDCAIGYLSFAHEVGHNFGCAHDPNNAGSSYTSYGFGHHWNNDQYRSVMAYSPGTRVPYFSNPNVLYEGGATGIANERDNARTINLTDVLVANMRTGDGSGPDCDLNGTPDELDIARDPLLDRDENGELDACQIASGTANDCDGDGVIDSEQLHPHVKLALGPASPLGNEYIHTLSSLPLPPPATSVQILVGATGDLASSKEYLTLDFNDGAVNFDIFIGGADCYGPGHIQSYTATASEFAPIAAAGVDLTITSTLPVSSIACSYSAVAVTIEYDTDASDLDVDGDGLLNDCEQLCPADVSGDGELDFDDVELLNNQFGQPGGSLPADITGDGTVDMLDTAVLQAAFKDNCS